ncbi:MAG TPA: peptidoglycan recognition family protein [Anaeromyxobacteraceae bacterium]|nr:peptidoglycan recognition family protein [Anaeromyxobacteraceae bacterium]
MPDVAFKMRYAVTPRLLTAPSHRRSGQPVSPAVKFLVAHDTGNPGSTAAGNVAYYERSRDDMSASAHLFVDDREIVECIPALTGAPEKAWHVLYGVPTDDRLYGYDANDAALGVEYCYGGSIDPDEAYRKYVWVLAYACHRFGLDPASSVVGHFFLDPARKTDPVTGLARSRRTYEGLLRDVAAEHAACTGAGVVVLPGSFVPEVGKAVAAARLNVRKGAPSRRADVVQVVPPGAVLAFDGWVAGGEPVNGNSKWYRDPNGNFFWSGGVRP